MPLPIRRTVILLLALAWVAPAGSGCSHLVKNDRHEVFSKARYGVDRFVVAGGYNIHYVEAGEGPTVLLISGAFSTYRAWNRMIPELSRRHRVLAIDYLGIGDSDKPASGFGYTVEEQADLVAKMIAALKLSGVDVVGASYGSAIALNLAVRHPGMVRKVVCIEGGALIVPEKLRYSGMYVAFGWPVLGDLLMGILKTGLFDEAAAKVIMGSAWDRLGPADRKEIVDIVSANIRTASRTSWYRIHRTIAARTDFTGSAKDSGVSVLYLYGEESKYRAVAAANAQFLRTHVPHSTVIGLPCGVHDLQLQQPAEIATLVLGFLEEDRAASGRFASGRTIDGGRPAGTIDDCRTTAPGADRPHRP